MKTAILLILLLASQAHARIWTNTAGKQIDAELVSIDAAASPVEITLRRSDGKVFTLSIDILSQGDQNYVLGMISRTPTLTITKISSTRLRLAWEEFNGERWVVQFSPDLGGSWTTLEASPTTEGASRSLELPRTLPRGFYRLIKE